MKKKLESELISIAHRILKLKGREDVLKMHSVVGELYEKLSVLKFAHENFDGDIPTIGNDSSFFEMLDAAFNNKISDNIEVEDKVYINLDDVVDDGIMEPAIEKIKDMVAQMPPETQKIDQIFEEAIPKKGNSKNNLEEITADFKDIPEFEPVEMAEARASQKQSLNDKLKGGIKIGLNDKLAFIKHLFNGSNEDYDRVLSQLNTTSSFKEATEFIYKMVKPDYNNWINKEDYEERFMEIIEAKFN